jgi:hypothetical protein
MTFQPGSICRQRRGADEKDASSNLGGAHDRKVDFCLRDDVEEVREHVLGDDRGTNGFITSPFLYESYPWVASQLRSWQ